ncbi:hypothetical protein H7X46_01545 [Pseudonocardia sp. C8]|uniref:hypothetical protein n=1 Tax=Pseudonocardia sp. C8 TaxID=2762759 RepID=UPI0016426E15|nr:hypothetical protein [Pseudonocardia sp. C8]MBC3189748.1 hypothetical protein [Pseudonocardia sp. C8]
MRTSTNVALQIGTVAAFAGLRLIAPGWFLAIMIFTIVGVLLPLVPVVLSIAVARRRMLPRPVAAPFVSCAGFLLLGGLVMPDFDDVDAHAPVLVLLGRADGPVPEVLYGLGMLAALGWLCSLLWLGVALARNTRPAGPPHPAWGQVPPAR